MIKKAVTIALTAGFVLAAQAADDAGTLIDVQGNVSVSGDGIVLRGESGTPLAEGDTILVSSDSAATVALDNGCDVYLEPGDRYTIDSGLDCAAAIASVSKAGSDSAAAGVAGSAADEATVAVAILGGAVAIAVLSSGSSSSDHKASGS